MTKFPVFCCRSRSFSTALLLPYIRNENFVTGTDIEPPEYLNKRTVFLFQSVEMLQLYTDILAKFNFLKFRFLT